MVFFVFNAYKNNEMPAGGWIAHVKATHKKMGGTYKAAMKAAAKTWKKGGAAASDPPKKKRRRKKKAAY